MMTPADLGSMEWLACSWRGTGLDADAQLTFAPPLGGSMMGMFKSADEERVIFYELIVIGEFDGEMAVRLKHFRPDMTGWEMHDRWMEFKLLDAVHGRLAQFDGLSFRLEDDGSMRATVLSRQRDGSEESLEFVYHRVEPC
ncbi:MAG: DUF6265 family protein [Gammaproteobacteria bacterium]